MAAGWEVELRDATYVEVAFTRYSSMATRPRICKSVSVRQKSQALIHKITTPGRRYCSKPPHDTAVTKHPSGLPGFKVPTLPTLRSMASLSTSASAVRSAARSNLAHVTMETVTAVADDGTARMIMVECTLAVFGMVAQSMPFGRAADGLLNEVTATLEAMNDNDRLTKKAIEKLLRVHGVVDKAIVNRMRDPEANVSSFQAYIRVLEQLSFRASK